MLQSLQQSCKNKINQNEIFAELCSYRQYKTDNGVQWLMWKLLHIATLINPAKSKSKYQYKLWLNMNCLRSWGQWNHYNTNTTTVLERSRVGGEAGWPKQFVCHWTTNTTSIIWRFMTTALFVHICSFKIQNNLSLGNGYKIMCKYMVQLPYKI